MKNKYVLQVKILGGFYIGLIPIFALFYYMLPENSFNLPIGEEMNFMLSSYFSVVTMTTLGFGDIYPITLIARIFVAVQCFLGVIVIGFFLNAISSKQAKDFEIEEEKKKLPIKIALYNEIRLFTGSIIDIWRTAYNESVPGKSLEKIEDLFCKEGFQKITRNLDLKKNAPVCPTCTWEFHLIESRKRIVSKGDKILNKYTLFLEYETFGLINFIVNEAMLLETIKILETNTILKSKNIFKGEVRLSEDIIKEKDFESIIKLINWCKSEYEKLIIYDSSLFELSTSCESVNPKKEKPDAMYEGL